MYIIENDNENAQVRRLSDNALLAAEPMNQDYCDFLTWISHQKDQTFLPSVYLPKGNYFADRDRFVKFCKDASVQLYAQYSDGHVFFTGTISPTKHYPSTPFNSVGCTNVSTKSHISSNEYGFAANDFGVFVTNGLREIVLKESELPHSEIRLMTCCPITRTFVYLDISDFSKYKPAEENLIVRSLVQLANNPKYWPRTGLSGSVCPREIRDSVQGQLCIGDGYIYVFESAFNAVYFAAHIAYIIEYLSAHNTFPVKFHFRIGIHTGEVFTFWDVGRNGWNYIGDGINGGQRVLSAIGKDSDDNIFVSSEVREQIYKYKENPFSFYMLNNMHSKGRREDKHKKPWRVYELNFGDFVPRNISPELLEAMLK